MIPAIHDKRAKPISTDDKSATSRTFQLKLTISLSFENLTLILRACSELQYFYYVWIADEDEQNMLMR
jgi:hypothetical protein